MKAVYVVTYGETGSSACSYFLRSLGVTSSILLSSTSPSGNRPLAIRSCSFSQQYGSLSL